MCIILLESHFTWFLDSLKCNSEMNFNVKGENVTLYMYITHLYYLTVQAGFYSYVAECVGLSPVDCVQSPSGKKVIAIFHLLHFTIMAFIRQDKPLLWYMYKEKYKFILTVNVWVLSFFHCSFWIIANYAKYFKNYKTWLYYKIKFIKWAPWKGCL